MPEISIIVPVYNVEPYIARCVESVLAQTMHDWELLLVDDGSPDRCGLICDRYAALDRRVRVLHTTNGGVSSARNSGLDAASGIYIAFLDGDDMLHPDFLSVMHSIALGSGTDIVMCRHTDFDSDVPSHQKQIGERPSRTLSGVKALEEMLYQTSELHPSVWGKLFRRDVWDGIRFVPGLWYEDIEVSARVIPRAGTILSIPDHLYFYRRNRDSFIHTFTPRRLHVLKAVSLVREEMALKHPALLPAANDRMFSASLNMLGLMTALGYDDKEAKARCWETVKRLRRGSLFNRRARARNRLTALLTYIGGRPLYRLLAKIVYGRDMRS